MRQIWLCVAGCAIGCGGCSSSADRPVDAPPAIDAGVPPVDAATICDPVATFSTFTKLSELNAIPGVYHLDHPSLTADERSLYFSGDGNLYAAHRSARTEHFEPPNRLPVVSGDGDDGFPSVSSDQLELWFSSTRGPGLHLYVATRTATSDDFGTPFLDPNVNGPVSGSDSEPFLTADGQQLWFASVRPESSLNIWHVTREGKSFTTPYIEPAFDSALGQSSLYSNPVLSANRLTIYVANNEPPGSVWRSRRAGVAAAFPPPTWVSELSMMIGEVGRAPTPGWLSPDNCRLYVTVHDEFTSSIYVATRHP